jgi:hypothetical protein
MASPEAVLISRIMHRHGSRPDLRLFRNATSKAWVGQVEGRSKNGDLLYIRHPQMILAGLCEGSSDLIGVGLEGRFIALEVKTGKVPVEDHQQKFIDMVRRMGGIAGVVRTMEDVDAILGDPPERKH